MPEYSPGPYAIEEVRPYKMEPILQPLRIYSEDPGPDLPSTVAYVDGAADFGMANARLFMGAPEVHEAATALMDWLNGTGRTGKSRRARVPEKLLMALEMALSKAL